MSVTWEPNTMILVPGIAARANGQRFMPMTMVSSHARVSLSTNDVSDSAVASDPSTTKTHTRGSHVVLMESPSDGDTAVSCDTSDARRVRGRGRGRAPAMPAPYRVPHNVVAKKLQKVQKDWKYSRRNRHNGRAARRVRAEQPWARNATG